MAKIIFLIITISIFAYSCATTSILPSGIALKDIPDREYRLIFYGFENPPTPKLTVLDIINDGIEIEPFMSEFSYKELTGNVNVAIEFLKTHPEFRDTTTQVIKLTDGRSAGYIIKPEYILQFMYPLEVNFYQKPDKLNRVYFYVKEKIDIHLWGDNGAVLGGTPERD
ncbi:MAG: hypothetical protein AB1488_03450 [Nitrospirota bacterium]